MPTWTTTQIRELSEAWRDGEDIAVLAERFNRTTGSLMQMLHRQGVKRTPSQATKLRRARNLAKGNTYLLYTAREQCPDVDALAGLFFEAAEIEARLPRVLRGQIKASWPEAPDDWQAFGWHEVQPAPRPANPAEVSRYDLALQLTPLIPVDERRLVWAVAHSAVRRARGPRWAMIGRMQGLHAQTVRRRFERAVLELWYKIQHAADGGCIAR